MQPSPEIISAARGIAEWLSLALETIAAVAITVGGVASVVAAVRTLGRTRHRDFTAARLELSQFLALALEFQLASDVLDTAISPDWRTIGHLIAFAAIRTALNYFLARDIHSARRDLTADPE